MRAANQRRAARGRSHEASRGPCARSARRRGHTLVEVLIAMLLLAFALLALASLQLATFGTAGRALEAMLATDHVTAHAERIRALHDAPAEARRRLGGTGAPMGCDAARACTPLEFAAGEAWRWRAELAAALPGASAPTPAVAVDRGTHAALRVERRGRALLALEIEA